MQKKKNTNHMSLSLRLVLEESLLPYQNIIIKLEKRHNNLSKKNKKNKKKSQTRKRKKIKKIKRNLNLNKLSL